MISAVNVLLNEQTHVDVAVSAVKYDVVGVKSDERASSWRGMSKRNGEGVSKHCTCGLSEGNIAQHRHCCAGGRLE